jgi:hypothetical protein
LATTPDSLIASLGQVRWFVAIGQSIDEEGVVRLASFDEWPGPEDPRVETFIGKQQSLKDELEASFGTRRDELATLWNGIHQRVFEVAGPVVGYDAAQDAWHGPTTATWHAAWTAGLVAWCQALEHPIPDWLAQQWAWFKRGRWPAGFAALDSDGNGRGCLVL